MRSGLVFGVGLAIMVAAPAVAQSLPPIPTPSLPAVPTVVPNLPTPPALPTPTLPTAPSVPSLPHVPSPRSIPAVPSVPGLGSQGGSSGIVPSGGSGGGASGGGGSSGSAGAGGRATGGGRRSGGSGAASSALRAGGGNSAATGRQGGSGSGSAPARPAQGSAGARERAEVRRDRRLRANVRPLERCVGALPRAERRVLTLRAGLGSERPRTRQRVAQILDVSTRRVRRLERRGVRRLRGLVRAGRCSGDAGIPPGDVGGGTIPADQAATLGALAATGLGAGSLAVLAARELRGSSGSRSDRVEVKGERQSSDGVTPEAAPPDAGAQPVRPRPPAAIVERGGADLTLPLLILVAVAALAFAVRSVRRSGVL